MSQENEAETLDEKDHYNFCRRVVSLALEAYSEPFVAAFYYHYGRHPNKLIPEGLQREEHAPALLICSKIRCSWCPTMTRQSRYEDRHRALHLCIRCQLPAGPISTILCEAHRKKNVLANREYRARVPRFLRGLMRSR